MRMEKIKVPPELDSMGNVTAFTERHEYFGAGKGVVTDTKL